MATIILNERGKIDIGRNIFEAVGKSVKIWQKTSPKTVIKNIQDTIAAGNSPVQGYGRFVKYSKSYKDAILKGRYGAFNKAVRPVNLKLSGVMLESLQSANTVNGFAVFFNDPLAFIHSVKGAGKSKTIRKVMPTGNERWKKSVTFEADETIRKILKTELGKIFR